MRILSVLLLLSTYVIGSYTQDTIQYATCIFEEISGRALINYGAHANIYTTTTDTLLHVDFAIESFGNTGTGGDAEYAVQFLTYGFNPEIQTELGECFTNDASPMGCPNADEATFRVGDIGNIAVIGQASTTSFNLTKPNLLDDKNSVIGRSIGIYEKAYKCAINTQTQASLGKLLTYCTIGVGNPASTLSTKVSKTAINNASSWSGLTNVYGVAKMNETINATDDVEGSVSFVQINATHTQIRSRITGLSYLAHGFHIHQFGDLTLQTGDSLGSHWKSNATQVHAIPNNQNRHSGDLGNFCLFDQDAMGGYYSFDTDYIKVANLIGRGMVIHKSTDNGTDTSFGKRDAQGVIALVNPTSSYKGVPVPDWQFTPDCTMASVGKPADMSSQSSNDNSGMVPDSASSLLPFFGLIIASIIVSLL